MPLHTTILPNGDSVITQDLNRADYPDDRQDSNVKHLADNVNLLHAFTAVATAGTAVATDAAAGEGNDISASASFTLSNPTNPTNRKRLLWRIYNSSGGAITVTLGNAFVFGGAVASIPDIAAGDVQYIVAVYRTLGGVTVWDVVSTDVF